MKTQTLIVTITVLIVAGIIAGGAYYYSTQPTQTPSQSPAITPQKSSTPTTSENTPSPEPSQEKPEPYFPYKDIHVSYDYSPTGMAVGGSVEMEVVNRGGAGEVFVSVVWVNKGENNSKVFYMDELESVLLEAYFVGLRPGPHRVDTYNWTARPALPGDASYGEITVIRSTVERLSYYHLDQVQDIAVTEDLAYMVVGDWGRKITAALCIVDVKDPLNPKDVGRYTFSKSPVAFSEYKIAVDGNHAYVTIGHLDEDEENGLHVIDVSDPSNPEKVGEYLTGGDERPRGIVVNDGYAYIITQEPHVTRGHLLIIDVNAPSNLQEVGRYEIGSAESVTIKDSYAYVVGSNRLYIIDISTPSRPIEVASYSYTCQSSIVRGDIVISSNHAFVVRSDGSLIVFNVTHPSNPNIIGEWSSEISTLRDVAVSGKNVYAASYKGLFIIDVNNLYTPKEVGRHVGFRKGGNCIAVSGKYAFLAGSNGLHIFELLNLAELEKRE